MKPNLSTHRTPQPVALILLFHPLVTLRWNAGEFFSIH
jgi:hypothetical protein